MKIIVVILVLMIAGSLGSALYYLVKDNGSSDRTVRALTWRVGLSIGLFAFLMVGFWLGLLPGRSQ